jgi:DNA-binding NtrC family response regulator
MTTRSTETQDDGPRDARPADPSRETTQLFLVLEGDRPLAGGLRCSLEGVDEVLIGRGPERTVRRQLGEGRSILRIELPGRSVSGQHARLVRSRGAWILEDRGSKNGTFVDGAPVARQTLASTASFDVGRAVFVLASGVPTPASAASDRDRDGTDTLPGLATLVPALEAEIRAFERIAAARLPLLLRGETGTGKELFARAAHAASGRTGRFVAINCGALPTALLESQLFGHERGAFSGAVREETGFVRAADGGTLFLDELGELPSSSQAALLRVLEEQEVVPVGASRPVRVDVRLVAATHRSLENDVATGRFRADLLARVAGYTHVLPPLRERSVDVGLLVAHALRQRPSVTSFDAEAARALVRYAWPLNGRELRQAIDAAGALATDGTVRLVHLPKALQRASASEPPVDDEGADDGGAEDELLRTRVVEAMRKTHGNIAEVARQLGKAPTQVRRWLDRWGLDPASFRVGRRGP